MIWFQFSLLIGQEARIVLHESMGADFDLWRGRLNLSLIFHLSLYQVICECCPMGFNPVLGQHCVIASVASVYFFPDCRQGISLLASQTCNTIHLPLMAWLTCSCMVYTLHVHFFLSSLSFATLRSVLVLHCWMDSVEFLGKKCKAFSSSLMSYALKFIPRWLTGKSELRSSVRPSMESFGIKCCKESLLMLPPCKHTPANTELTCTENQAYVGWGGWKDKLWKELSAIKVHNPAWELTGRSGSAICMN